MAEQSQSQRAQAILTAWKAGKKSVSLLYGDKEVRFNLRKQVKEVIYQTGPMNAKTQHKRHDVNIVASPADGKLVPRMNVKLSSKQLS